MGATLSSILSIENCSCGGNKYTLDLLIDITEELTAIHELVISLEEDLSKTDTRISSQTASIDNLKHSVEHVLTLLIERALPAGSGYITPVPTPRHSEDHSSEI